MGLHTDGTKIVTTINEMFHFFLKFTVSTKSRLKLDYIQMVQTKKLQKRRENRYILHHLYLEKAKTFIEVFILLRNLNFSQKFNVFTYTSLKWDCMQMVRKI